MALAESVKVGSVIYDVIEKDVVEIAGNKNYLGACDYSKTTIEIAKNISDERKINTFVHELLHAILNEAGYAEHEEEFVERVASVLCQVLRDNDFGWMRI